jgi:hypothetical protein
LRSGDARITVGELSVEGPLTLTATLAPPAGDGTGGFETGDFEIVASGARLRGDGGAGPARLRSASARSSVVTGRLQRTPGGGFAVEELRISLKRFEAEL